MAPTMRMLSSDDRVKIALFLSLHRACQNRGFIYARWTTGSKSRAKLYRFTPNLKIKILIGGRYHELTPVPCNLPHELPCAFGNQPTPYLTAQVYGRIEVDGKYARKTRR